MSVAAGRGPGRRPPSPSALAPEPTEGAREERGGVLLEIKFKETIRTCLNQTGAKVSLNWTRAIFYPSRIAWRDGLFGGGPDPAPWTATHVLARRRSRLPPHGRAVAFPIRLLPERRNLPGAAAPRTSRLRAAYEPPTRRLFFATSRYEPNEKTLGSELLSGRLVAARRKKTQKKNGS